MSKIKVGIGKGVKPSKYTMNIISNIKSQLFREDNTLSIGDKIKGSFELKTDIQPELRKIGDVVDEFEINQSGELVLNKKTEIGEDWVIKPRESAVSMIGEKENEIHTAVSKDGSDIIIEDGAVGEAKGLTIEGNTIKQLFHLDYIESLKSSMTRYPDIQAIRLECSGSGTVGNINFGADHTKKYTMYINVLENTIEYRSGYEGTNVFGYSNVAFKPSIHFEAKELGMKKEVLTFNNDNVNTSSDIGIGVYDKTPNGSIKFQIMIFEGEVLDIDKFLFAGLNSTQAVIENNGAVHSFYEPIIKGETKVVETPFDILPSFNDTETWRKSSETTIISNTDKDITFDISKSWSGMSIYNWNAIKPNQSITVGFKSKTSNCRVELRFNGTEVLKLSSVTGETSKTVIAPSDLTKVDLAIVGNAVGTISVEGLYVLNDSEKKRELVSLESTDARLPVLGSVPSVADTLDRASGVLTENTFEEVISTTKSTVVVRENKVVVTIPTTKNVKNTTVICNSLISRTYSELFGTGGEVGISCFSTDNTKQIMVAYAKSELDTPDIQGVAKKLQANPITVRYQLTTPIQTQLTPSQVDTYSQHKKVILLSKVGDVADKLELKDTGDSVWNKNYGIYISSPNSSWSVRADAEKPNTLLFRRTLSNAKPTAVITYTSDIFQAIAPTTLWGEDVEGISINTARILDVRIKKTRLSSLDLQGFLDWLNKNNFIVMYQTETPTTTHIPKSLTPTIPINKINTLSVGGAVKASKYQITYPSDTLRSQIRINTLNGANKINTTDNVKPSLFKGLFPVRKLVNATFSTGNVTKNITVKVLANNDMGENNETDVINLYKVRDIKWTYKTTEKKVVVSFLDEFSVDVKFKVRYKIGNGEYQYEEIPSNNSNATQRRLWEVPLEETDRVEFSLCPIDANGKEHIYSDIIMMGKTLDTNLVSPSGFTYAWQSENELQLKWRDDYSVENEFELIYSIDGGEEVKVYIPKANQSGVGDIITHTIRLEELQTINAKLRMNWFLNSSEWSYQTVTHNLKPPTGIQYEIVKEGTHMTWTPSYYAEWYRVFSEGVELALATKPNCVITKEINGEVYVVAYKGGFISDPSESVFVKSKPNAPINLQVAFDEVGDEYDFNISFIDNSQIETNYRVEYKVDDGQVESITIEGTDVVPPNSVVDSKDPYKLWTLYEKIDGSDCKVENGIETLFNEDGTIATHKDSNKESIKGDYIIFTI